MAKVRVRKKKKNTARSTGKRVKLIKPSRKIVHTVETVEGLVVGALHRSINELDINPASLTMGYRLVHVDKSTQKVATGIFAHATIEMKNGQRFQFKLKVDSGFECDPDAS